MYYIPIQEEKQGYALADTELRTSNTNVIDSTLEINEDDLGDPYERRRKFTPYRYKDPDTGIVNREYLNIGSEQSLGISPTLALNYTLRTRTMQAWSDFVLTTMKQKVVGHTDGGEKIRTELVQSLHDLVNTGSAMVTNKETEITPLQFANHSGTSWDNFHAFIQRTIIDDTKLMLGSQVTSEVSSSIGNAEAEERLLFRVVNDEILMLQAFINEKLSLIHISEPTRPY